MRTLREVPDMHGVEVGCYLSPKDPMLDWPVIEPPAPGGPVYVVTKQAWERAVCAYSDLGGTTHEEFVNLWRDDDWPKDGWRELGEEHWGHAQDSLRDALAALLGSVRVAKKVGWFVREDAEFETPCLHNKPDARRDEAGVLIYEFFDGDTVAVLEDA